MLLKGKRIFITGGSRGIGAASVAECVRNGAAVGYNYHKHSEGAKKLSNELGDACRSYKADVRDPEELSRAIGDFCTKGGLDGLVVNAGIYRRNPFSELDIVGWRKTMSVNLDGAFLTVREALEHMKEGSVVIVSSQLAYKGSSHGADYSASKSGLIGLNASLARELAPLIRVNAIAPGYVDTDLLSSDTKEKRKKREHEVPLGRVGDPLDIARPIVFLLSELSSYMTGSVLDVNGGLFIH